MEIQAADHLVAKKCKPCEGGVVSIELWTHAIGGLSENDFILAAKVDQVSVETKG